MTKLELKEKLDNFILKLEKDYKDIFGRDIREDVTLCPDNDVVKYYTTLNHMECALCSSGEATEFEVETMNLLDIVYAFQW